MEKIHDYDSFILPFTEIIIWLELELVSIRWNSESSVVQSEKEMVQRFVTVGVTLILKSEILGLSIACKYYYVLQFSQMDVTRNSIPRSWSCRSEGARSQSDNNNDDDGGGVWDWDPNWKIMSRLKRESFYDHMESKLYGQNHMHMLSRFSAWKDHYPPLIRYLPSLALHFFPKELTVGMQWSQNEVLMCHGNFPIIGTSFSPCWIDRRW